MNKVEKLLESCNRINEAKEDLYIVYLNTMKVGAPGRVISKQPMSLEDAHDLRNSYPAKKRRFISIQKADVNEKEMDEAKKASKQTIDFFNSLLDLDYVDEILQELHGSTVYMMDVDDNLESIFPDALEWLAKNPKAVFYAPRNSDYAFLVNEKDFINHMKRFDFSPDIG